MGYSVPIFVYEFWVTRSLCLYLFIIVDIMAFFANMSVSCCIIIVECSLFRSWYTSTEGRLAEVIFGMILRLINTVFVIISLGSLSML